MPVLLVGADGIERIVGIRTNDAAVVATLRERLAPLLIDYPDASSNISIKIGRDRGRTREVHQVYRRGFHVKRTLSIGEAVEAAVVQLHTFTPPPPGLTPLNVKALERDGSVILATDNFATLLDASHRRLEAAGHRLWDHDPVLVDTESGEALLPEFGDLVRPTFRRVPISHVLVFAPPEDREAPASVRLSHIAMLVAGRGQDLRADRIADLVRLTERVRIVRLETLDPREVTTAVLELC